MKKEMKKEMTEGMAKEMTKEMTKEMAMKRDVIMKKEGIGQKVCKVALAAGAVASPFLFSYVVGKTCGNAIKGISSNTFIVEALTEGILALFAIAMILIFRKQKALKFSSKGLKEGIVAGAGILFFVVLAALSVFVDLGNPKTPAMIRGWEIALLMFQCVFVGIFEEGIFRGVVLELMMDVFGCTKNVSEDAGKDADRNTDSKKAIYAIICASLMFGCVHLTNAALPEVTLLAAAFQGISSAAIGMVFGAIYYRAGRSIWVVGLIHAVFDAAVFVQGGALFGQTVEASVGKTNGSVLLYAAIFIAWFLFLMRDRSKEA